MAIAAPQPRVLADVVAQTWVRNLVLVVGGAAFVGLSESSCGRRSFSITARDGSAVAMKPSSMELSRPSRCH